MKISEAYSRNRKKSPAEVRLQSSRDTDPETRTVPFAQLPSIAAEGKAQGKIIVAMQWSATTYTVTIRQA